jgi:hypothetical protein
VSSAEDEWRDTDRRRQSRIDRDEQARGQRVAPWSLAGGRIERPDRILLCLVHNVSMGRVELEKLKSQETRLTLLCVFDL